MELFESNSLKDETDKVFEEWKKIITENIPDSKIEHIGSTAIYGALTKGDVDIYVEVPASVHAKTVTIIESLGFSIKTDTHRDKDLCMLENKMLPTLAIQVVAQYSKYEFFLLFRDKLNSDYSLVQQYNNIKKLAAEKSASEYRELKSIFIQNIIAENE